METAIGYVEHAKQSLVEGDLIALTERELNVAEVEASYRAHLNESLWRLYKVSVGIQVEKRAHDLWVKDHHERMYLDCVGGFGVFSFGHTHPEIVRAVSRQMRLLPLSCRFMLSEPLARLARVLAAITPAGLSHTFLCNSGTEAVEAALKLARAATGRRQIISMNRSFHGKTYGALSVSGGASEQQKHFRHRCGPFLPECWFVDFGDLDQVAKALSPETAAVIVEPIQGEGGVHLPPPNFLRELRQLCTRHGSVLIVDEVQTGLGRTGNWFACAGENITPDLLCLGKALGGGIFPIGAVIGTPMAFAPLLADPLFHTSTFGGNPLACMAALAAIRILIRDRLAQNALVQGKMLLQGLGELLEQFPELIQEIRGKGLMIGVEMRKPAFAGNLVTCLRRHGVLACHTLSCAKVIRLEPPLTIDTDTIELLLRKFQLALEETQAFFAET